MNNSKKNYTVIGIVLLVVVILLLLVSPNFFFAPVTKFIDTDLYSASADAAAVRTKTDFGSQNQMTAFPLSLGKWKGINYDTTDYIKRLGGDVMLVRQYNPKTFTQPVFFTIVQARTESSFHPPKVCLTSQGYKIQEEGDEKVIVQDADWAKGSSSITIPLHKLVVTKNDKKGNIIERRLVLYCYVKGNQYYSDNITLIEVAGLVPINDDYGGTLGEAQEFVAQAMPLLFQPGQNNQWQPLIITMVNWGLSGFVLIVIALLTPLILLLIPLVGKKKTFAQRLGSKL
jgi:hypothetical protein